jgi:hypothetical protein
MFRRPMRRGPGVVSTVARTAVIAGTATAVSRGVSGAMAGHQQEQQQEAAADQAALSSQAEIQDLQAQMSAMQAQQAASTMPASSAPAGSTDLLAQLNQLTQLNESGALTEEEFTAAKAKLLGG